MTSLSDAIQALMRWMHVRRMNDLLTQQRCHLFLAR